MEPKQPEPLPKQVRLDDVVQEPQLVEPLPNHPLLQLDQLDGVWAYGRLAVGVGRGVADDSLVESSVAGVAVLLALQEL